MHSNLQRITDNVEGETQIYKHKFGNLEKSLKDLSQGGLFQQIEQMVAEVRRLTQLNEKYEMRYFLLSLEIERRGKIIADYLTEIENYRASLLRRDTEHSRELERIRDEEVSKIKLALQLEFESMKQQYLAEKSKGERRCYDLEVELTNKNSEVSEMKSKIKELLDCNTSLKLKLEDASGHLKFVESKKDMELSKQRADQQQMLRDLENRFRGESEQHLRQMAEEKFRELAQQKSCLEQDFIQELQKRDAKTTSIQTANNQNLIKLQELEAELSGLRPIMQTRDRECEELRTFIEQQRADYESKLCHLQQETVSNSRTVHDKLNEMTQKLAMERERSNQDLNSKSEKISKLEYRILELESALSTANRAHETTKSESENLKQEIQRVQNQKYQEIRSVEEHLTVTVEEKDNEITSLLSQIANLHEMYQNKMHLEQKRGNDLGAENEQLKRDNFNLGTLSDTRKKEIEDWCRKYKDYLTPEEAFKLKSELNELRKDNMSIEDENIRCQNEITNLVERLKTKDAETQSQVETIRNLNEHLRKRADAILQLQKDKDDFEKKIRANNSSNETSEAERMVHLETEIKLRHENEQLKEQRDLFRQKYEESLTELAQVNQKYTENMVKTEEQLGKMKNGTQTTSHMVRTSQVISKTHLEGNY